MSVPLSGEWFDSAATLLGGLDSVGKIDATMRYAVASTPQGKVMFRVVVAEGCGDRARHGQGRCP